MAEEFAALQTLPADHTVPLQVFAWTAYRCQSIGPLIRCFEEKNAPFMVRDAGRRGLGLFASRKMTFEEMRKKIVGHLNKISTEDYTFLKKAHHPSLYKFAGNYYVLTGFLALVNHDCQSSLGFSRPTQNGELLLKNMGDTSYHPGIQEGEEIVVRYGFSGDGFDHCLCRSCAKKRSLNEDVSEILTKIQVILPETGQRSLLRLENILRDWYHSVQTE